MSTQNAAAPSLLFSSTASSSEGILLHRASGHRCLSKLYEYELSLHVASSLGLSDDVLEGLLTNPVSLRFGPGGACDLHGVLREITMMSSEGGDQPTTYRAILVPRLWRATQTYRSRIYQDMKVGDLIKEVLTSAGLTEGSDFTLNLTAPWYPKREYTVQYEESDFDFIARQMEHYGIFFYFEQNPDSECLVIGDDNKAFAPMTEREQVEYIPGRAGRSDPGSVRSLDRRLQVQPKQTTVRDYNYRTGGECVENTSTSSSSTAVGEQHYYGEHFKSEAEGNGLAAVRMEATSLKREHYHGEISIPGMTPGNHFELVNHPLALDQALLVTSIKETYAIEGMQGGGSVGEQVTVSMEFEAIPLETQFRPERVTPKPRIYGHMHATIDGDANLKGSVAADLDDSGRYAVLFPYDGAGKAGGRASRRIRMAQPSAGEGYGMHFPLRIGTEVAITHVNGDPDRPVISGAVPNPRTESPITGTVPVTGEGSTPESAERDKGRGPTISRIQTASGITISFYDDAQQDDAS